MSKKLDEKMKFYENTIELIKKEFETMPQENNKDSFDITDNFEDM